MGILEDRDDVWNAFLMGEMSAFEEIYKTYIQELINYGYRITSNREIIKDCIQDLFVSIWNSKENLSRTGSIRFYLFRSLRNRIIRQLQREEGRNVSLSVLDAEETPVTGENEEEYFRISKFEISLPSAIAGLPERQREVIQLRYYHDFELEEISEIMSISNQSVRNTLHKAIDKLRGVLGS